ncbi:MAG: hypothetical protein ACREIT_06395 [Tepidisphaeraceae bacterium]
MVIFLKTLVRHTLNSVLFGIALMVLIGLYIAVGSGVVEVREFFEMNELEFFNAWPLKVLMVLLVMSLATVTWTRIPFTPPRYGVWCIHAGIITLIIGMSFYYANKTEGLTRIGQGQTVDSYYDTAQRSLYVKVDGQLASWHPLPSLPRFKIYQANVGAALRGWDLRGIEPYVAYAGKDDGGVQQKPLAELFGWPAPLRVDVSGYWPYANVVTRYVEDPSADVVGVRVSSPFHAPDDKTHDPTHNHAPTRDTWLVASDPRDAARMIAGAEVEHRTGAVGAVEIYAEAATKLHRLDVKVGGAKPQSLFVEVGKTYPVGDGGYMLTVEGYTLAFPMSGTGEIVKALTLKVKSPTLEFRRMVLDGKELQTDFKLDAPDAGPMGARQKEPLDTTLQVNYRFTDTFRLAPRQGSQKYTLLTPEGSPAVVAILTRIDGPAGVTTLPNGNGEIDVASPDASGGAPFMAMMRAKEQGTDGAQKQPPPIKLAVQRADHLRRDDQVEVVPPHQRDRNFGQAGVFQVVQARVSMGDWSQDVLIPYLQDVAERPFWDGPVITPPGTRAKIQLQLGHTRLALPAKITLQKFELVPYPGAPASAGAMMRDFKSTLLIEDLRTGDRLTGVAHMNHPVYFPAGLFGKQWLFYQAQWDPDGQKWSVIGVGNRPGVWIMTAGCAMMLMGLLYAFYVKPIMIRRMKAKALATTGARKPGRKPTVVPKPEMVA